MARHLAHKSSLSEDSLEILALLLIKALFLSGRRSSDFETLNRFLYQDTKFAIGFHRNSGTVG